MVTVLDDICINSSYVNGEFNEFLRPFQLARASDAAFLAEVVAVVNSVHVGVVFNCDGGLMTHCLENPLDVALVGLTGAADRNATLEV